MLRCIIFYMIYPQAWCMARMFTGHRVTRPETDVIPSRPRRDRYVPKTSRNRDVQDQNYIPAFIEICSASSDTRREESAQSSRRWSHSKADDADDKNDEDYQSHKYSSSTFSAKSVLNRLVTVAYIFYLTTLFQCKAAFCQLVNKRIC